ncbi:hypothetical protein [Sulfurimonas sp. NWX367]|uniref:hypothetical protein n=1 Tax=unclassified Sulfurimonas TaxID=2623549 RepID=UPI0032047F34
MKIEKMEKSYLLVLGKDINISFDRWEAEITKSASGYISLWFKGIQIGFIIDKKEQLEFMGKWEAINE